jgi:hypothetical protein
MSVAGSRACTRRHGADSQLDRPAPRFCNSQMARGLPSALLNVVVLGHQPPYQTDRPQCARDIRGRIGLRAGHYHTVAEERRCASQQKLRDDVADGVRLGHSAMSAPRRAPDSSSRLWSPRVGPRDIIPAIFRSQSPPQGERRCESRLSVPAAAKSMSDDSPYMRSAQGSAATSLIVSTCTRWMLLMFIRGKLTLRCEQGHTTVVTLPIPAFELLFDVGCSALLDGYQREAVTSFAASFERFQEFACRFLLARRNVSFEGVDAWWKEVAAQSERQKGSFVALWIAEFFREPLTLPKKLDELRNNCVRKGRIPPESEAKAYGEAVLRAEVGGIVTFRNCFNDELAYDDFVEHHIIRPDENEPLLMSFLGNTVISGIWRSNEPRPDEDEPESGEGLQTRDQNQRPPKPQKWRKMAKLNRRRRWRGPALGGRLQRGVRFCFSAHDGEATSRR